MKDSKNILIIGDMPGYGKMGLAGMLPILSNMGHSVYNLPTRSEERRVGKECRL